MRWKISDKSLFAILMRSPWWISAGIAAAVIVVALALLPDAYRIPGAAMGIPFLVTGGISAWRQMQAPSARRIDRTFDAVRAMSWSEFARATRGGVPPRWLRGEAHQRTRSRFRADPGEGAPRS